MTEHRGHGVRIVRVFAEGVIVRNRFRFRINHEFVRVAAAGFAIECGAPLAENLFQLFLRNRSDLLHGFDSEGA